MKILKILTILSLISLAGLFSPGCKSNKPGSGSSEINDITQEADQIANRVEEIKNVYNLCPSPSEMLSIIDYSSMSYNSSLLNPVEKISDYIETYSQTMNLGVYITDMAFAALFSRTDETIDYLEIVQELAEKVRVEGALNEEVINRARENVENLDTLLSISNEVFINMLFYCEKNSRSNTIALISGGAFIESLYLAVSMVEKYDATDHLVRHLAEQKYAIDNLMLSAEELADDANVARMIEALNPIKDIYDNLKITIEPAKIKKDGANKLVIGGGDIIYLSEEEFKTLKEVINTVRKEIT